MLRIIRVLRGVGCGPAKLFDRSARRQRAEGSTPRFTRVRGVRLARGRGRNVPPPVHRRHQTPPERAAARTGQPGGKFELARDLVALHLPEESRARHPEYTRGVRLDVLGFFERLDDADLLLAFHFLEGGGAARGRFPGGVGRWAARGPGGASPHPTGGGPRPAAPLPPAGG